MLPLICGFLPLKFMIMKHIVKFYDNCFTNDNATLQYVCRNALYQCYSTTNNNIKYIASTVGCTVDNILKDKFNIVRKLINSWVDSVPVETKATASVVTECMNCRDGVYYGILTYKEFIEMLEKLCINYYIILIISIIITLQIVYC